MIILDIIFGILGCLGFIVAGVWIATRNPTLEREVRDLRAKQLTALTALVRIHAIVAPGRDIDPVSGAVMDCLGSLAGTDNNAGEYLQRAIKEAGN